MAMVKLGAEYINIKGKFASNYFQSSKHGIHIKACPRRVKSQNSSLTNTHKIFTTVRNAWVNKNWSLPEVETWNAYLKRHPSINALGDLMILTHQLGFYHFNLIRVRNALPITYTPPREIV